MQSVLQGRKTSLYCSHLFAENCSMTSVSCFNQQPSAGSLFVVPFLLVIPIILKVNIKYDVKIFGDKPFNYCFPMLCRNLKNLIL